MANILSDNEIVQIEDVKGKGSVPDHIAIIMDGNGRWAKSKNLPRAAGHRKGVETVRTMVQASIRLGVKYLTLYTFSTENWKRPQKEISMLMRLMVKSLQNETNELNENDVKITTIGNIEILPTVVQKELNQAKEITKDNKQLVLNLALSYSGRWEIVEAAKRIAEDFSSEKIKKDEINEDLISKYLSTSDLPDPDLMIRSGGEHRVSNFLIWQIAYSELFVSNVLWPDFKCRHLLEAIEDYQKRERRFGLISEQVSETCKRSANSVNLTKQIV